MEKLQNANKKMTKSQFFEKFATLIGLLVVILIFSMLKPKFLDVSNIFNLLRQASINGLLALGMTYVVLTGGIDLSVGSILGASGIFAALVAQNQEIPWFVAVLAGLAIGLLLGTINGVVVSWLKVPAFVATLGMLSVARGITYLASNAQPVPGLSEGFLKIGGGSVGIIPIPVIILAVVFIICSIVLYRTKYGRYIYGVGGNARAARVSGINVKKITCSAYMIAGVLAGLAGVVLTSRVSSGLAMAGQNYETDAIAAVVMGGTSLAGGKGRLWGTLIGVLIIAVLNNGLDMMAVSSYWQLIIKGTIIVAAVMMDSLSGSND